MSHIPDKLRRFYPGLDLSITEFPREDGAMALVVAMVTDDDKIQGKCYTLFKKPGQQEYLIHSRSEYKNGEPTGRLKIYHANGKPSDKLTLIDGKKEGLCEEWHGNGQLKKRASYTAGKLCGISETWCEDGTIFDTSTFVNGVLHGMKVFYDRQGNKSAIEFYFNGVNTKFL